MDYLSSIIFTNITFQDTYKEAALREVEIFTISTESESESNNCTKKRKFVDSNDSK